MPKEHHDVLDSYRLEDREAFGMVTPKDMPILGLSKGDWLIGFRASAAPGDLIICEHPQAGGHLIPARFMRLTDRGIFVECVDGSTGTLNVSDFIVIRLIFMKVRNGRKVERVPIRLGGDEG